MNLVLNAIRYGDKKHKGQKRKISGEDYFSHPLAVSYIVAAFKSSKHLDELLAAAILHDTLEDTKTNFSDLAKHFTPLVASLVFELTTDENEKNRLGKTEYLKKKLSGISNYALVIKLADRLHNMSDSPTEKSKIETKDIIQHLNKTRKLTSTQKKLIEEIEKML